jgi:hypothetical protein
LVTVLCVGLACGCASSPTGTTTSGDEYNYSERISLVVERATTETARQVISTCEPCREDFRSTQDILNAILEEIETRRDLAAALAWMKVTKLIGPDGSVIIEPENVMLIMNPDPIPREIPDSMIYQVGVAVWVGLNKAKL